MRGVTPGEGRLFSRPMGGGVDERTAGMGMARGHDDPWVNEVGDEETKGASVIVASASCAEEGTAGSGIVALNCADMRETAWKSAWRLMERPATSSCPWGLGRAASMTEGGTTMSMSMLTP